MSPKIDIPLELTLPPPAVNILKTMFKGYHRVIVKREFGAGLTNTRVFLVRPVGQDEQPEIPMVIKMGPASLIEQEWQAFRQFIRRKLPRVAEIKEAPVYDKANNWAGLRYLLAGDGIFEVESLFTYFQHATTADLQFVLEEQLFRTLGPMWRHSHTKPDFSLGGSYDPILPVNLCIEPASPADETPLQSLSPDQATFSQQMAIGDYVQLSGFIVTEIEGQTVILNLPDSQGSHRLRLQNVGNLAVYQIGQVMPDTMGRVVQTRSNLLRGLVEQALDQPLDLTTPTLPSPVDGTPLPNPLTKLPAILNTSLDVRISGIHGDLNLENVLIEHYQSNRNVYLIDFANARQDHVLHDLLRLETEIIGKLLAPALADANLTLIDLLKLYRQLHCTILYPTQTVLPRLADATLEKPFAMLVVIRRMVITVLFNPNNWLEYYHSLTLYLLGALKFKNLDDIPRAKQTLFWTAVAVQQLLSEAKPCRDIVTFPFNVPKSEPGGSKSWQPNLVFVLVMGGLLVILLVIAVNVLPLTAPASRPTVMVQQEFTPPSPTLIPSPAAGTPMITVLDELAIRQGPGEHYDLLGIVPANAKIVINGRDRDNEWWQVKVDLGDGIGWVSADPALSRAEYSETIMIIPTPTLLPIATQTSSPTATPTSTPSPTATSTSRPTATSVRSTPTPSLTPTTRPLTGEFTLLNPTSENDSYGETVFEWQWTGNLGENQGFEVRIWLDGKVPLGVHDAINDNRNGTIEWAGNNIYRLIADITTVGNEQIASGEYNWSVWIVQIESVEAYHNNDLGIYANPPGRFQYNAPFSDSSSNSGESNGSTGR